MKKFVLFLIAIVAVGIYFYNTIWFQSLFNESFYNSIVNIKLDVTKKGEKISVPLLFKYDSCYCLGIKIPGREASDSLLTGKGVLRYQFILNETVVTEGVTQPVTRRGWGGDDEVSIRKLMVFDLPLPYGSKELTLRLEVIEPFSFLDGYKGQTSIDIRPNYEPKAGKCYDEDLRIDY